MTEPALHPHSPPSRDGRGLSLTFCECPCNGYTVLSTPQLEKMSLQPGGFATTIKKYAHTDHQPC
eukprot:920255-Amphidinium_carterae.1